MSAPKAADEAAVGINQVLNHVLLGKLEELARRKAVLNQTLSTFFGDCAQEAMAANPLLHLTKLTGEFEQIADQITLSISFVLNGTGAPYVHKKTWPRAELEALLEPITTPIKAEFQRAVYDACMARDPTGH